MISGQIPSVPSYGACECCYLGEDNPVSRETRAAATVGAGVAVFFFFECKSDGSAFAGPSDRRANQSAVRLFCLTSCSAPAGTRKNSSGHVTEGARSANRGARSEPASWSRRRDGKGPNNRKQGGGGHAASLDWCCLPPLQQVIDHVNDHADGWSDDDLKGLGEGRRAVWDSCPAVSTAAAG